MHSFAARELEKDGRYGGLSSVSGAWSQDLRKLESQQASSRNESSALTVLAVERKPQPGTFEPHRTP